MPAIDYRIWQWGNKAEGGTLEAYHVGMATRAKHGGDKAPFAVANELVSLRLGRAIGLPIPDGFIIWRDDEPYFASMNFNLDEWNLPPADVAAVAAGDPRLACGVLVFDSWIVNYDRHDEQLHYDKTRNALFVIDHHAALYGSGQEGFHRLVKNVNSIGIGPHCLMTEIGNLMFVDEWINRIAQIPEYFIRDTILEAVHIGIPITDLRNYLDFLLERRGKLKDFIRANRQHFSKAKEDLFFNAGQLAAGDLEFQI